MHMGLLCAMKHSIREQFLAPYDTNHDTCDNRHDSSTNKQSKHLVKDRSKGSQTYRGSYPYFPNGHNSGLFLAAPLASEELQNELEDIGVLQPA